MKRISRLAALTIATSLTVSGMTVATAEEAQTPPAAVEQAAEITKEDQGNPTTGNNNGSPDTKDAEKAKKAIPGITSTTALNDLTKYLKGARDEFRNIRATIDTVPNDQNKSSDNSKVKTIIAVLFGVLGLGAIAAAIVQFAGPALKAFGINLPGL